MSRIISSLGGFRGLFTLLVVGLITALIIIPGIFNVTDASVERTRKIEGRDLNGLPKWYDIRERVTDPNIKDDPSTRLEVFRSSVGSNAAKVADIRDGFVRGEEQLRGSVPNLKIEYNNDIRIPEVISPKVDMNHVEFLTGPSGGSRVDSLRNFLKGNDELIGVSTQNIDRLKVGADYVNPDGNLSFVRLEQEINEIPVFRGEVNAGFTKDGRMIRVINNLAPGVDASNVSADFGDPEVALRVAAKHVKFDLSVDEFTRNEKESTANIVKWGREEFSPRAEKMYFPTEPGVAVPAWRVALVRNEGYYVIVEPHTGTVLWHKNLLDEQNQTATYQVYRNANAFMDAADSPAPLSPYISNPVNDPTVGVQGALLTRTNITRVGNEGADSFNTNGWITDNTNITDGNNTEAGLDRVAPDGIDATLAGDTACPGAGCRVFSSLWNPPPGNPPPGDEPLTTEAQRGAVIQMFYVMNLYHDELYKRGFTEEARNFQHSNFGRGGSEGDRVRSEGQDSSGTNNANFLTQADGTRPRMQMFLFTGPTPDRDGTTDAEIIIHEVTHGLSNRLHGNASGLGNQGGMMGEGWGDWYANVLLSEPSDPVGGIYATGGYTLLNWFGAFTGNYYYGIRRFPRATIATTGGPDRPACNNGPCPHNPLTFGHLNAGCDTTLGTTTTAVSSAFPRHPTQATSGSCSSTSAPHNAGEVWSSVLWEVRARLVNRLGFAEGTRRSLQIVTDGMKLSPISPTFLQGRDAIIAAAAALSFNGSMETSADVADVREGFRVRGMGFSASVQTSTSVTEAFDFPNVRHVDPFSAAEAVSGNDGDTFPEPGENLILSVPVTNPNTGGAITNVAVNVNGGPNVNLGTLNDGQTVVAQVPYTVPGGATCGSMHQVTINVTSSVGAQTPVNREFRLGAPVGGAPVTFTNNTLVDLPAGQPTTTSGPGGPYPSNIAVSGLSGQKIIKVTLNGFHHTWEQDLDFLLVGPGGQKFVFLSDRGGTSTDAEPPRNISFADNGTALAPTTPLIANAVYLPTNADTTTDAFPAPAPASPYQNPAPAGSATFASTFGTDGTSMNGTWSLYSLDDVGSDEGRLDGGWSITFDANDYTCVNATAGTVSGRVVTVGGRGIGGVTVAITDGGTTRRAMTNSFGYFTFTDVSFNVLHTITPKAKRYTFTPQQITPTGNVTGLVFVGT